MSDYPALWRGHDSRRRVKWLTEPRSIVPLLKIPLRPLEMPIFRDPVVKKTTTHPDFGAISLVQRRKKECCGRLQTGRVRAAVFRLEREVKRRWYSSSVSSFLRLAYWWRRPHLFSSSNHSSSVSVVPLGFFLSCSSGSVSSVCSGSGIGRRGLSAICTDCTTLRRSRRH